MNRHAKRTDGFMRIIFLFHPITSPACLGSWETMLGMLPGRSIDQKVTRLMNEWCNHVFSRFRAVRSMITVVRAEGDDLLGICNAGVGISY